MNAISNVKEGVDQGTDAFNVPINGANEKNVYYSNDNLDDLNNINLDEKPNNLEVEPIKHNYLAKHVDNIDKVVETENVEEDGEENNYAFYPTNYNYPFEDEN